MRAIEDILATWREAERLLEALPRDDPERPLLLFEVVKLRSLYQRLTDATIPATDEMLKASRDTIERARLTLKLAQQRLGERSGSE